MSLSHTDGLTAEEAARRLASDGPNELPAAARRNLGIIVRDVLGEPMFLMLLAAGGLYLLLGDVGEALTLLVFANLSVGIAVVQEVRSERTLDALRELTVPTAVVIRSGNRETVPARELVRGDLVVVGEGGRVPADARLVEGAPLEVDESLLTGESVPVRKRNAEAGDEAPAAPGGDDYPWLHSGTLIVRGQGRAVVTATGPASAIGRIGRALESIHTEPPRLHAHTRRLVRIFGTAGVSLSVLVVVLYVLLRGSFVDALLAGIAIGMSLLPEEFPLVLSVFMVMGAWRISRARVLARRAAAIESLGAATVLCTDKTGTLTRNHMEVAIVVTPPAATVPAPAAAWPTWTPSAGTGAATEIVKQTIEAALLASSRDALDPMDRAVHESAAALIDGETVLARHPLVTAFPLAADLPVMASVFEAERGVRRASAKGAPEAIASLCGLGDDEYAALAREVDRQAKAGIRVLAVACVELPDGPLPESPRAIAFQFVGLVGFADPVREGVPEAVAECRRAGVRVAMITGDYPATARAIAIDAGIDGAEVLTGSDLDRLCEEEIRDRVGRATVFARIRPEQKLQLVEALKARGEVVAMIGDGVNDAPALRAAHIGVAMGKRGTDVAREAAGLVLLDDDFRSVVATLRLGRRIYDNLRKAMGYVIALHVPIAGLAVLPLLFGMPLILTPTMIAFLEMIIDPVCSVVFESEPDESNVMHRPPRDPQAAILPGGLILWCASQGAVALAFVAGVFLLALRSGESDEQIRSTVFACLVATNFALLFTNRSFAASWIDALKRPNHLVWWAAGLTTTIFSLVVAWEPARRLFRLGEIHPVDLGICLAAGAATFAFVQLLKRAWKPRLAA